MKPFFSLPNMTMARVKVATYPPNLGELPNIDLEKPET
jgi:hypothetical protein